MKTYFLVLWLISLSCGIEEPETSLSAHVAYRPKILVNQQEPQAAKSPKERPREWKLDQEVPYSADADALRGSVAMIIEHHLGSTLPKEQWGRLGQSLDSAAKFLRQLGLQAEVSFNATTDDIENHIKAGRQVIAFGWLTSEGHHFVVRGFETHFWIVNDPLGEWRQCRFCGHRKGTHGRALRYHRQKMNRSVLGNQGSLRILSVSAI